MEDVVPSGDQIVAEESPSLSYKFQRLREKLRKAIADGDLSGKLPGERTLSRRFHVNAKTLSKALTDLAAEGLLERSIGRGTYVRGSAPPVVTAKRWLVICEASQAGSEIVSKLRQAHPEIETLTDVTSVRPSFLNQYSAVITLWTTVPDSFIRDLVVRNVAVVCVGQEPRTYSTHAVVFDRPLAVSQLARELLLCGHRRFAAVEPRHCTVVADSLRQAAARYATDATIDARYPKDAAAMVEHGVTAFVCHSIELAKHLKQQLDEHSISVPERASLVAIGSTSQDQPVSGYFVRHEQKADAIVQLLQNHQSSRPTTIWIAGHYVDRGTMAPLRTDLLENLERFETAAV